MTRPLPLAVFVSGQGTTLDALAEVVQGGHLPARISIVLADRPHAVGIERARHRGLPTEVLPFRGLPEAEWVERADRLLHARGVELVVLAGFLAILPTRFVELWEGRIINLHPSLLPRYGGRGYYGSRVLEAIIDSGDQATGVSVHLVTPAVDEGPVLEQREFHIAEGETVETLRERIRPYEIAALESVIRQFADGTLPLPYHPPARATPTGARRRPG
ncbi:MAG TPA: phosphoribosylglycinamide formyltransferase [Thermoplasmata archaeon]|nr:phosphoribosylglycinamide formyltransferase [Thermoplasmata archaeon]